MNRSSRHLPVLTVLAAALFSSAAMAASPGNDPAALAKIRDTAMQSDYAWERIADMTDLIGPRLSGSPGAAAAVTQVAEAMRKLGAKVSLQPVKVPHWVRGAETGELVEYSGRPQGITQRVVLTALGGSGATPAAGLTAPVVVIKSFDELKARGAEVRARSSCSTPPSTSTRPTAAWPDRPMARPPPTAATVRAWRPSWARSRHWCARSAAQPTASRIRARPACRTMRASRPRQSPPKTPC